MNNENTIVIFLSSLGITGGHKVVYQHIGQFARRGYNVIIVSQDGDNSLSAIQQYFSFRTVECLSYVTVYGIKQFLSAFPKHHHMTALFMCFITRAVLSSFTFRKYHLFPLSNNLYAGVNCSKGQNETYYLLPWDGIWCNNDYLLNIVHDTGTSNALYRYNHYVDTSVFYPGSNNEHYVGYFDRYMRALTGAAVLTRDATEVVKNICRTDQHRDYIRIYGNEVSVATLMRVCGYYLHLTRGFGDTQHGVTKQIIRSSESFGLGALEAMASGCLVIGFDAIGGKTFMNDANTILANNYDTRELATTIKEVFKRPLSSYTKILQKSIDTARTFNEEASWLSLQHVLD